MLLNKIPHKKSSLRITDKISRKFLKNPLKFILSTLINAKTPPLAGFYETKELETLLSKT
ncbi:MAG TPA: hypothetical protein DDW90_00085 [Cyanobacteria bacterium UBA9971]|nr:hypothetical protein [Cyanobacteria bacterium UBA9971]